MKNARTRKPKDLHRIIPKLVRPLPKDIPRPTPEVFDLEKNFRMKVAPHIKSYLESHLTAEKKAKFYTLIAIIKRMAYLSNPVLHIVDSNHPEIKYLSCLKITNKVQIEIAYKNHREHIGHIENLAGYIFKNFSPAEVSHKDKANIYWYVHAGKLPTHKACANRMRLKYIATIGKENLIKEFFEFFSQAMRADIDLPNMVCLTKMQFKQHKTVAIASLEAKKAGVETIVFEDSLRKYACDIALEAKRVRKDALNTLTGNATISLQEHIPSTANRQKIIRHLKRKQCVA